MNDAVDEPGGGIAWLVRLRWLTLSAQALAALAVEMPRGDERWMVGLVLGVSVLSNLTLHAFRHELAPSLAGPVLIADTVTLTAHLHAAGGPMNPFTAMYFVHLAFASVLASTHWVWGLTGASVIGFGALFLLDDPGAHAHGLASHLRGMWGAFVVAAGLIAFFVGRHAAERAAHEEALRVARQREEASRRAAALTQLAAGAAHELGSPIATIGIAAGELERALADAPPEVLEDVALIRDEVRRCRAVLLQLGAAGGELPGERLAPVALGEIVDAAIARARVPSVRVEGERRLEAPLPRAALVQALTNLLDNAADAGAREVTVTIAPSAQGVVVEVADDGPGMSPSVLERAREPFFTTKEGGGMGIGLFLVDSLVDRLGGRLDLRSSAGAGTRATLTLPARRGGAA